MSPTLAYIFGIGTTELLVIAIITLILFGNRLPSVMRSLGRGVVEFKKGIQGIEEDLDDSSRTAKKSEDSHNNRS
ncbi:MAG: twin-arginine translocase TatA/TatE family subunit [Thermoguttaceae bacterium]|nr:twin-arginine translocase TatA/TatE family subunit [Thermoguttaceae bacterium]MDW8039124.1 twin-arginine translocase TatA/TatE family subunit [Thermoguttaceae bacterium]